MFNPSKLICGTQENGTRPIRYVVFLPAFTSSEWPLHLHVHTENQLLELESGVGT